MTMKTSLGLPLVSVRILTYNSSKYITETLDSIFKQTYQNIELVISDDCSTDDTVFICQNWIKEHRSRFSNVVFLTVPTNTGVCANSKRSLEATTGDWIKGLGGDDCLFPTAIEEYIKFVQKSHCDICAAKMDYMDDNSNDLNVQLGGAYDNYMNNLCLPYDKQYRLAKEKVFVPGPVLFYSRKVYEATGGPDYQYGSADEWSFLYRVLKNGYRVFYLDRILIRYRVHEKSLTRCNNGDMPRSSIENNRRYLKEVILKDTWRNGEYLLWWHLYVKYLRWGNEKMRLLNCLDPLWLVEQFKKRN